MRKVVTVRTSTPTKRKTLDFRCKKKKRRKERWRLTRDASWLGKEQRGGLQGNLHKKEKRLEANCHSGGENLGVSPRAKKSELAEKRV